MHSALYEIHSIHFYQYELSTGVAISIVACFKNLDVFSSLALSVCDKQLIIDEAVYGTAPATPVKFNHQQP